MTTYVLCRACKGMEVAHMVYCSSYISLSWRDKKNCGRGRLPHRLRYCRRYRRQGSRQKTESKSRERKRRQIRGGENKVFLRGGNWWELAVLGGSIIKTRSLGVKRDKGKKLHSLFGQRYITRRKSKGGKERFNEEGGIGRLKSL